MFRRLIYLTAFGLLAAALLGSTRCQNTVNNGIGPDGANFVTTLAVEDANGNAASSFSAGQQIQFVLSVRNRSTTSQTISFSTAQQFNFAVVNSGSATEVWTWSLGQAFSQIATRLTLQAGQTQTFTVIWNQVGDNGQLVPSGNYEVIGGLTCNSGSASGSSNSSANVACMPSGVPGSGNLAPSVYVSTLVPFTIQ
ncbi:MAG: hypothetical protein KGL00_08935 [Gammaproteobacteria bacterium]|nr:hypothetical protein [Gammaproteobacteria bacterium]MDE1887526.1 hypothetical protein [Gammaproteobacteria bacterium]MDE2023513.1 hypothetical protein [Gammaproteobacteria bacterium]MDE2139643.1 hypothetical protein [Gammaproteobacteria bacterium]MDE2274311.1 hypothetical protein [Gammaproteobacteria bacterium]